jgi:hypothetical protein
MKNPSIDPRMNARAGTPGKTRTCPHCKATILDSASICPGCQHHLRFDRSVGAENRAKPSFSALQVEGAFRTPQGVSAWEYSVVVSVKNERGEEVARKVVGVGALDSGESRTVTLSVDVFAPGAAK